MLSILYRRIRLCSGVYRTTRYLRLISVSLGGLWGSGQTNAKRLPKQESWQRHIRSLSCSRGLILWCVCPTAACGSTLRAMLLWQKRARAMCLRAYWQGSWLADTRLRMLHVSGSITTGLQARRLPMPYLARASAPTILSDLSGFEI